VSEQKKSTTKMTSKACDGITGQNGVEATLFREKLWTEEPKMDAAIKAYCSWLLAQHHGARTQQYPTLDHEDDDHSGRIAPTTTSHQHAWEMKEVLGLARKLSKSINAYVFDIRIDESMERSVVAQVWNEVAAMSNNNNNNNSDTTAKPRLSSSASSGGVRITKMLGQTALIFAWKDLDRSDLLLPAAVAANEQQQEQHEAARLFLETFERFMFANIASTGEAASTGGAAVAADSGLSTALFNDAQLIWSPDGGKQELSRRATQRQKVALERLQQEEDETQRLLLLPLQQQEQAISGSRSAGIIATAASTPTITIIEEEGDEKEG
jgi:hypothetical protein